MDVVSWEWVEVRGWGVVGVHVLCDRYVFTYPFTFELDVSVFFDCSIESQLTSYR